jgi:membrane-associated protease RseP (regulator of RpoE activity)
MSDESPREASPAPEAGPADEPTLAGDPTAVGEPAAAEAPPPPPPPAEPPGRRDVRVPRWAAFVAGAVVAVLVLFFGGFAVGRATSDGDGEEGPERRTEQELPRPEEPGEARPAGVFLGVASRDAMGDVQGAEIAQVVDGSPAADAGLQEGDVVTEVDGTGVSNASDLREQVRDREPGDEVTITYTRDGDSAQARVTLEDRSDAFTPSA